MVPLRLGEINRIRAPPDLSEYEPHLRVRMNEGCGDCPLRRAPGTDTLTGTLTGWHRTPQQGLQIPVRPLQEACRSSCGKLCRYQSDRFQRATGLDIRWPPAVPQASGVRTDSPMSRSTRSIKCGKFTLFAREGRLPRDRQRDSHHGPPSAPPHEAAATPAGP